MRTYRFVVGSSEAGLRLDRYLLRRLPQTMSRSMIQRGVREGRVRLRDQVAKPNDKLRVGDVISAVFPELGARAGEAVLTPQAIPLEIVFEDAWLLVVNKPAGLVTHPAPGHWDGTLVNAILWHLHQRQTQWLARQLDSSSAVEPTSRPVPRGVEGRADEHELPRAGIVHRLDKDTSGLLLVAKTEEAHIALSRQLKARTIRRRYLALVEGHMPLNQGTIDVPIGRHAIHRKEMTVRHLGGRSAVTHYRVLKRFSEARGSRLEALGKNQNIEPTAYSLKRLPFPYTLLEVTLDTGRTHQIRVHMAHVGHPVIGDTTYGNHPPSYWAPLGIARHLLHAVELTFQHPVSRKTITVSTALPEEMTRWL